MTTPRPNRWSMTIGGTLPFRKPGMFTCLAMAAYALSMLGLKSANGTSTVIFTRVGLNCSTVLGTLGHFLLSGRVDGGKPAGGAPNEPGQSYGCAYTGPTGANRAGWFPVGGERAAPLHSTRGRPSAGGA